MLSCMSRYLIGKRKLVKTGYSLRLTIPNSVVEKLGLEAGDEAELILDPAKGQLIVKFPKGVKK